MFEGLQSQQPPAPEGLDLPPIFGAYPGGDCSANPFSPAAVSSFVADPFLVLDHDLDDVSEVIKHNILTDESSGSSTPLSNRSLAQRMSKDSIESSSNQQNSEFATSPETFDPSKEHEIGQIVSLLQEEEPPMVQQQHFVGEQQRHNNYNNNNPILEYSPGEQQQFVVGTAMITNGGREGTSDPMIGGNNGMMSPNEGQQPEGGGITVAMGEYLGDQMHQQQLDYMMIMRGNNGNELEQYSQHYQLASLQHNFHFGTEIDPNQQQQQQQFVGLPLALDTTIPLEPQPPMVDFPEANRHIKQEIVYGGGPSDLAYQQQPTATAQFVDQQEDLGAAVAAKNELIRLLLEMSPQELEQLRAQRAAQNDLQHQQHLYQHQQYQQEETQSQMFVAHDHPLIQAHNIACHHQQQQYYIERHRHNSGSIARIVADYNGDSVFPSSSTSATSSALTSPTGYTGQHPPMSLAPSDYFGEEGDSAMDEGEGEDEIWEGEAGGEMGMTVVEEGKVPEGEEGGTGMTAPNGGGRGGGRRRGHKTERRTAHNLIEKKYRCSINDRINQLKGMLATEETTKLSKSATLRRAVDHIFALRTKNADLAGENARLRQTLEMAGLAPPPPQVTRQGTTTTIKQEIRGTAQERMVMNGNKGPRGRAASVRKQQQVNAQRQQQSNPNPNKDQSRVTLCVFMFLLLAFNPLASLFLASDADSASVNDSEQFGTVISEAVFTSHHRTLLGDDRFSAAFAVGAPAAVTVPPSQQNSSIGGDWWLLSLSPTRSPLLRHSLVWLLNSLLVFLVLTRLLVYGEPVAVPRSPRWGAFVAARQRADEAIASGNHRQAQRELGESLQILQRPLPHSGSVDEWMSLTWQIIRHLLNGLWIGRWFARRRRPSVPRHSVCRSHAATALVCHQLHQLHLLDVDGIGLTPRGALNLALLAANLAESAGPSAIAHSLRTEIYVCAALRARLCLPKCVHRVVAAYFFRRAKRHVRKSGAVEGVRLRSLQWLFHPLARRFLSRPDYIATILSQSGAARHCPNWPFSGAAQSARPVAVLRDAFKMHLLRALLGQLEAPESSTLRVADFVEQYQLLFGICQPDTAGGVEAEEEEDGGGKTTEENGDGRKKSKAEEEDEPEMESEGTENGHNGTSGATSALRPCLSEGDELCAWWTHLVAGGLHWRHGDSARAQQHFAHVRKCPLELAQNDLALALGFAFCTRKMCFDDRQKGKFAEMVVWHARRANAHLKRGAWTAMAGGGGRERAASLEGVLVVRGTGADQQGPQLLQCQFRLLCCQWLLSSLLDVWSFCFAHCGLMAPLEIRRLYADVLGRMEREQNASQEKLTIFRQLGKALCGMHLGQMGPLLEEEKGCPSAEKQIEIQSAGGDIGDL